MEPVSFLGLGNMGIHMAHNLLRAKFPLFAYNRSPKNLPGAHMLTSPREAFEKAAIAVTMLANDAALEEVNREMLHSIRPGCIHISMSSVSPETIRRLQKHYAKESAHFVAAPVFGRPDAAEAAKLVICMAGDAAGKKRAEPILRALGQSLDDFGEDAAAALVVKLAGNFTILAAIEAMGEAMRLAENNGIERVQLASFFGKTIFSCRIYQNYGEILAKKAFEGDKIFKMSLGMKDLKLALEAAGSCEMPFGNVLRKLLQEGIDAGKSELDWSAITQRQL